VFITASGAAENWRVNLDKKFMKANVRRMEKAAKVMRRRDVLVKLVLMCQKIDD